MIQVASRMSTRSRELIERISFCPMWFKSNMRKGVGGLGLDDAHPELKEGIQDCKLIPSVKR